jgi:citrate lyase synthetase
MRRRVGAGAQPSSKLTTTDKHWLVHRITSGKADNAVQLTRQLKDFTNTEVSAQTVRYILKKAGLRAVAKKGPRLLRRHVR